MKEVTLPSGAVLKIRTAPWAEAKALFKAISKMGRGTSLGGAADVGDFVKDLLFGGFSDPEVEKCLAICLSRCTYNDGAADVKIDDTTFENEKSRQDYVSVCMEVIRENVGPFAKSLYAEWLAGLRLLMTGDQKSKSETTT